MTLRPDPDLLNLRDDVSALDAVLTRRPLAAWRPWDREAPRTSQRRELAALANHRTVVIFGGNRCLGGETPVLLADGTEVPIRDLRGPVEVMAWDGERMVRAWADPHRAKGPDPLFRVELADGSAFIATRAHRVLAPDGWTSVGGLVPGNALVGVDAPALVTAVVAARTDYHYDLFVPDHGSFIAGGVVHHNSGKTEGLRACAVALALGSDHPDAIAFWTAIGVDPKAFPEGPGRVWIVALTSNDSIRYHRKQVLGLIPKWGPRHPKERSQNWHAWQLDNKGESRLEIMVPGYSQPAEIVFKSEDQGEEAMQGDSARAILHDEEGGSPKTWREASVRLWDQDGWQLMSNTPIRGKTWVFEEFVRSKQPEVHVGWIHTLDNPWLPAKKRIELAAKAETDPVQAAIRQRGEFVALEGRVWPQFSRATHVIPPVTIPDSALRFRVIDFGTRDPFVCGWGALLRHPLDLPDGRTVPDGTLIIYREHYQAGWTLAQHVERIRTLEGAKRVGDEWEGGETIEITWADPEDRQQLLQLNHTHSMTAIKARKAVHAGLSVVGERLSPDATGWPRLLVTSDCPHHIESIEGYMWAGSGRDEPAKGDDHCCDTTRYLSMGVRAGYE